MTQPSPYFIRRTTPLEESDPADNRVTFFDDDEGRIDFNQYWRIVRKNVSMIVAIFVGVTLLTMIRVLMETPLYTAEATILIKPGTPQIFGNMMQSDNGGRRRSVRLFRELQQDAVRDFEEQKPGRQRDQR